MTDAFAAKIEKFYLGKSQNENEFLTAIKNIKFEDVKEMVIILNNSLNNIINQHNQTYIY